MDVILLNKGNTDLAEFAAAVCVNHEIDTCYLAHKRISPKEHDTVKGMHIAIDSGHLGVLEPISLSWYVEGISRACSHQLVRHQMGVA